jgi:TRAP-type mannitol/chloroaromatic compound transport system permease small subunit
MISAIARFIDAFTYWIGERIKWLTTILVVLICTDVLMRYLFATSKAWLLDLEWHVFALIFVLGGAYTLKEDRHVRVDVFYSRWSDRTKAWVDIIGTWLFLFPWTLIVIYTGFRYAENAYLIHERSADPGGLAWRFLIKGSIAVGFLMLLLQAFARSVSAIRTIVASKRLDA